jgi:hypothetical protein
MQTSTVVESPLWEQFQSAARQRRRDPARLLMDYMRDCLEVWEDQRLDEEIRRDVQRGGRRESQSVEIVRKHRRAKRT